MDWLNVNTLIDAALGQSQYEILNALLPIGAKVLGAALVLVIGWIFAAWFSRTIDRFLEQRTLIDATIEKVLIQVIRFAILTVTVLMALQMFGVQTAKRVMRAAAECSYLEALDIERDAQSVLLCAHDFPEAMKAFSEKRTPEFKDR